MSRPPPQEKSTRGMTPDALSVPTTSALEKNTRDEIIDGNTEARKRSETIARCRRQLASAGATLVELSDASFMVVCGSFSRHCQEIADVQSLLRNARAR